MVRFACTIVGLAIALPAWAADVAGTCGKLDDAATKLTVSQARGRATVAIAGPAARKGQMVRVDYDGESFVGHYDANGQATINFTLMGADNRLIVRGGELGSVRCQIAFPEIDKVYRVVLRWRDPVRFDLHAIEPSRRAGGYGDIHPDARNTQLDRGLGQIDVVTDAGDNGATGEQSYVIDDSARPKDEQGFTFRIDYVSRGQRPAAPYCGSGALAVVPVSLIVVDKGKRQAARDYEVGSVPCGQAIPDDFRLMRLR